MIDLTNTCVLVRTKEENEMILKEAKKQGFHWYRKNSCEPLQTQHLPDILNFYKGKDISCATYVIEPDFTFYEASELLNTKEMTAREFAEHIADIRNCRGRNCSKCILSASNTKCKMRLCDVCNWENNINELIKIVKSGRITVPTPEEKAIETFEKFIENPDCATVNDEFVESLKLAVEKLKEVE